MKQTIRTSSILEPEINGEKSLMVGCTCHGEAIEVTYWPNQEKEGYPDEFWFSIWERGFSRPLCWRERWRWIWNILRTGNPWSDHIIVNTEQALSLAEFIKQHAKNVNETKQ